MAELFLGKALFPGTSTSNQLERITEVTGQPSDACLKSTIGELSEELKMQLASPKVFKNLRELIPAACSDEGLDLMRKLLAFDPDDRLPAGVALEHPYLVQFHDVSDEPSCSRSVHLNRYITPHVLADKDLLFKLFTKLLTKKKRHSLEWQTDVDTQPKEKSEKSTRKGKKEHHHSSDKKKEKKEKKKENGHRADNKD